MNTNINSIHHTEKFAQNSRAPLGASRLRRDGRAARGPLIFPILGILRFCFSKRRIKPILHPLRKQNKTQSCRRFQKPTIAMLITYHIFLLSNTQIKFLKLSFSHGKGLQDKLLFCFEDTIALEIKMRTLEQIHGATLLLFICKIF